jgi:hypothetical protein
MMSLNLKQKLLIGAVTIPFLMGGNCSIGVTPEDVAVIVDDFAHQTMVMMPVTATEVGYHTHTGPEGTIQLDEQLGDYSAAGIQGQIAYYDGVVATLADPEKMPEDIGTLRGELFADVISMEDRTERALFELQTRQQYATDPNFYMELLGRALLVPTVQDYAPEGERAGHVTARLQKVPELISQAKQNLTSSSELQIEAAKSQLAGLIEMISEDIPAQLPSASGADYTAAADGAAAALRDFDTFLGGLATTGDWRMGASVFEEKLKLDSSEDDLSLDQILTELQTDYDDVYSRLMSVARPIHRGIYGNQRPPNDYALMRDILDIVAEANRLNSEDGVVAQVEENIETAKTFMVQEELMTFPTGVELSVSQTPVFLRDRYPVSAFESTPILDPDIDAHFWVTPLPADASRAAVLAKLREYNNFKLQIVAVDALARYLQSAVAATGNPEMSAASRLVRNVNGNRAYINGWSIYLTNSTMDEEFNKGNQNFQLNWLKYKLEFLANAMLDIKLHTQNMSVEEAEAMLQRQVFMEAGAVSSAVRTLQLNPTSSAIAYIGSKQWLRVRTRYQEITTDFQFSSFHQKALSAGALPPAELVYLTTEGQGRLE